ncbi:hypothetical protein GGR53DRAFT_415339 [Hypoxylon sp. FL1150]|nr:hypothetical protein GGR53DRAFT_415339 [Hypoxylon sp. FL1150]
MDQNRELVLELLRHDVEEAFSAATDNNQQPDITSDKQVASQLFLEDMEQRAEASASDRRMSISMQRAVGVDHEALDRLGEEERVAQHDRRMSIDLSNNEEGTEIGLPPPAPVAEPIDEESIENLRRAHVDGFDRVEDENHESDNQPEASASAASNPLASGSWAAADPWGPLDRREKACDSCRDTKPILHLAKAACGHFYCRGCLDRLFHQATVDENLFPPRCCRQNIDIDRVKFFLKPAVAQAFLKKVPEYTSSNRIYCHKADCAAFIPSGSRADDAATCIECGSQTCIACKNAQHDGDCQGDEQLQQVLQLAKEEGWQRCPDCRRMVELVRGCNHITCPCGVKFCYMCAAVWRTCTCPMWDESRLLDRAVEINDRENHPEGQGQRFRQIMNDLLWNHECTHEYWYSRGGAGSCEECGDIMPLYLFECQQCLLRLCRDCRYHRI